MTPCVLPRFATRGCGVTLSVLPCSPCQAAGHHNQELRMFRILTVYRSLQSSVLWELTFFSKKNLHQLSVPLPMVKTPAGLLLTPSRHLVSRLRMSGAIPLLLHVLSLCAPGWVYRNISTVYPLNFLHRFSPLLPNICGFYSP